jgi:hypothetical protein
MLGDVDPLATHQSRFHLLGDAGGGSEAADNLNLFALGGPIAAIGAGALRDQVCAGLLRRRA